LKVRCNPPFPKWKDRVEKRGGPSFRLEWLIKGEFWGPIPWGPQ